MMFSNGHVEAFDTAKPDALMPLSENPRVKAIAGKERFYKKDGKPVSKNKLYQLRDGIFEAVIDRFYKDPTLVAYGEDVRDWGGAFCRLPRPDRGAAVSPPVQLADFRSRDRRHRRRLRDGRRPRAGRTDVLRLPGPRGRRSVQPDVEVASDCRPTVIKMPLVLRVSVGSKYGAQHSQDWTALTAHIPGLKVVFPATPYDAKGMMAAALAGTDPVVFFESQRIYDVGEMFHEDGVPAEYYEIELGKPDIKRKGDDVTILTFGAVLYRAMTAAETLQDKYGLSAEIIDARSLVPFDYSVVLESVKKTGRLVVVTDACERGSYASEVARNVTELGFDLLDAPPVVGGRPELDHARPRAGGSLLPAAVVDPRRDRRPHPAAARPRARDEPDARRKAAHPARRHLKNDLEPSQFRAERLMALRAGFVDEAGREPRDYTVIQRGYWGRFCNCAV